jgi:tubulin beta
LREIFHMQVGQRWNQMGIECLEVLCDERGIGSKDAQLDRVNVFYHEASGGKYVPHAVLYVPRAVLYVPCAVL